MIWEPLTGPSIYFTGVYGPSIYTPRKGFPLVYLLEYGDEDRMFQLLESNYRKLDWYMDPLGFRLEIKPSVRLAGAQPSHGVAAPR